MNNLKRMASMDMAKPRKKRIRFAFGDMAREVLYNPFKDEYMSVSRFSELPVKMQVDTINQYQETINEEGGLAFVVTQHQLLVDNCSAQAKLLML